MKKGTHSYRYSTYMYFEWWLGIINFIYLLFHLDTEDTVFVSLSLILIAICWAVANIRCTIDNAKHKILERLDNNDKTN